jgi:hypothetical protein
MQKYPANKKLQSAWSKYKLANTIKGGYGSYVPLDSEHYSLYLEQAHQFPQHLDDIITSALRHTGASLIDILKDFSEFGFDINRAHFSIYGSPNKHTALEIALHRAYPNELKFVLSLNPDGFSKDALDLLLGKYNDKFTWKTKNLNDIENHIDFVIACLNVINASKYKTAFEACYCSDEWLKKVFNYVTTEHPYMTTPEILAQLTKKFHLVLKRSLARKSFRSNVTGLSVVSSRIGDPALIEYILSFSRKRASSPISTPKSKLLE